VGGFSGEFPISSFGPIMAHGNKLIIFGIEAPPAHSPQTMRRLFTRLAFEREEPLAGKIEAHL
jgi:hypothetical protein